ncbi:CRP-like cAMP-binding protein [Pedobacter sp. UYP30]|uniref:Crp/Fnr family transcriptional regulator n=1 Tax=Pedobacter sp. UYP30 TaxID=1756400 RepID=UPI003391DA7F
MEQSIKLIKFRKALEQFIEFDDVEWEIFQNHLAFKSLNKKEYFIKEGEICNCWGFIVEGALRYYHLKDGVEITNYFSFENELASAYKSFLTKTPAQGYIQALEKTDLILILSENLQKMAENPVLSFKMERLGRKIAEFYICCYEDRVSSFVTKTPQERYLDVEKTAGKVLQRIPQRYVANFLGITPVSLSRIRKRILTVKS